MSKNKENTEVYIVKGGSRKLQMEVRGRGKSPNAHAQSHFSACSRHRQRTETSVLERAVSWVSGHMAPVHVHSAAEIR